MKLIKYFLILLLPLLYGNAFSNPLDNFIASLEEQEASVEWVKINSQVKLSEPKIQNIVRTVYAHAISIDIDPKLVLSMIKTESGFRDNASSTEGAKGLMQVIPKWHKDKLKGRSPTNSVVSIEVGTTILNDCLTKFNNNHLKSFNCYSGGGGLTYYQKIKKYQNDIKLFVKNITTPNLLIAKL